MNIQTKPKIAICFFGITRSLSYTIDSIENNVLAPARKIGEVEVFAHFYTQESINNTRTGESTTLCVDEHKLLKPDWLALEEPGLCLLKHEYEQIKSFGDVWNDDGNSIRNLIHQLHSLDQVSQAALKSDADVYIFVRPDLEYHDDFETALNDIVDEKSFALIPSWQHWADGYNDRFAICSKRLAEKYGGRIHLAKEFCRESKEPLHSERLLRYSLKKEKVTFVNLKASRVRADGVQKEESFLHHKVKNLKSLRGWKRSFLRWRETFQ